MKTAKKAASTKPIPVSAAHRRASRPVIPRVDAERVRSELRAWWTGIARQMEQIQARLDRPGDCLCMTFNDKERDAILSALGQCIDSLFAAEPVDVVPLTVTMPA